MSVLVEFIATRGDKVPNALPAMFEFKTISDFRVFQAFKYLRIRNFKLGFRTFGISEFGE